MKISLWYFDNKNNIKLRFCDEITWNSSTDFVSVYRDSDLTSTERLSKSKLFPICSGNPTQIKDLRDLVFLNRMNLIHILKERFLHDKIYTKIGDVLIAVNPYKQTIQHDNEPNINHIADITLQKLRTVRRNQTIICSGESGSGKTESTKMIMRHIANGSSNIESTVLKINPILEAFGNATTTMNENSSRYARLINLHFDNNISLTGLSVETFLLEKSRVTNTPRNEQNFHILKYLYSYCNFESKLDVLALKGKSFAYLNGVQPDNSHITFFRNVSSSLKDIGITGSNLRRLYYFLGAILNLGNINFLEDSLKVTTTTVTYFTKAAELLCISEQTLYNTLTKRQVFDQHRTLSYNEAILMRDSLAKTIYNLLFHWIISHINQTFKPKNDITNNIIGILDIFGFENFEYNSFEQLCINYANEHIQGLFNTTILESEQKLYSEEKIYWKNVNPQTNDLCLKLIDGKPQGIFSILDSTCLMPGTKDSKPIMFVDNLYTMHRDHSLLLQSKLKTNFQIKHFAGNVSYCADEFVDKNDNTISSDIVSLLKESSIEQYFSIDNLPGTSTKKRFQSIGQYFSKQLIALNTRLIQTDIHFVKCIRPNDKKQSDNFDIFYVNAQILQSGLVESVHMLKYGFPFRISLNIIQEHFEHIQTELGSNPEFRLFVKALLNLYGFSSNIRIGLTKLFFKETSEGLKFKTFIDHDFRTLLKNDVQKIRRHILVQKFKRSVFTIKSFHLFTKALHQIRRIYKFRKLVRIMLIVVKTCNTFKTILLKIRAKKKNFKKTKQQLEYRKRVKDSWRKRELQHVTQTMNQETQNIHTKYKTTLSKLEQIQREKKEALMKVQELSIQLSSSDIHKDLFSKKVQELKSLQEEYQNQNILVEEWRNKYLAKQLALEELSKEKNEAHARIQQQQTEINNFLVEEKTRENELRRIISAESTGTIQLLQKQIEHFETLLKTMQLSLDRKNNEIEQLSKQVDVLSQENMKLTKKLMKS